MKYPMTCSIFYRNYNGFEILHLHTTLIILGVDIEHNIANMFWQKYGALSRVMLMVLPRP